MMGNVTFKYFEKYSKQLINYSQYTNYLVLNFRQDLEYTDRRSVKIK